MIEAARTDFSSEFFMETFMLGAWLIWKQRNGTNFSRGHVTFHRWKKGFIDEAALQAHRMKGDKHNLFSNFLNLYRYFSALYSLVHNFILFSYININI
jgi:hypothetical protein